MYLKKLFLFFIFTLGIYAKAWTQSLSIDGTISELFVNSIDTYIDSSKNQSPEQISKNYKHGLFLKKNHFGDQIGLGTSNFWLALKLKNTDNNPLKVIFEIPIARLDSFSVYTINKDNSVNLKGFSTGIGSNINLKPLKSFGHAVSFTIDPLITQSILIKLNKYPGAVRACLIILSENRFYEKQRETNSKLSFFIGIGFVVLISSISIGYLKKDKAYYIFSILTFMKICLNLQIFNYSQFLQNIGFDRIGTSIFIVITLYFQYQFFKLYFNEKTPQFVPYLIVLLFVFDYLLGYKFQGNTIYYYSPYVITFYFSLFYFKDIILKIRYLKPRDYPFMAVQFMVFITLGCIVLKPWLTFYDAYLRKQEYVILFWSSLIELIIYLIYLFIGILNLNKSYLQKSKELLHSQNAIIETQENERKRIAQDLHDDLGATLALLSRNAKKDDVSKENQGIIEKAIQDLRNISRNLLPADFETFGLLQSLEKYFGNLNTQNKTVFTFISFGEAVKLKNETELNIYRIITELANNIVKHSGASKATAQLIYHKDHLFISIEDTGTGIEISKNNLGIGLKNVTSRVEYLQAKVLEFGTGPNSSFVFEIPYKPHLP